MLKMNSPIPGFPLTGDLPEILPLESFLDFLKAKQLFLRKLALGFSVADLLVSQEILIRSRSAISGSNQTDFSPFSSSKPISSSYRPVSLRTASSNRPSSRRNSSFGSKSPLRSSIPPSAPLSTVSRSSVSQPQPAKGASEPVSSQARSAASPKQPVPASKVKSVEPEAAARSVNPVQTAQQRETKSSASSLPLRSLHPMELRHRSHSAPPAASPLPSSSAPKSKLSRKTKHIHFQDASSMQSVSESLSPATAPVASAKLSLPPASADQKQVGTHSALSVAPPPPPSSQSISQGAATPASAKMSPPPPAASEQKHVVDAASHSVTHCAPPPPHSESGSVISPSVMKPPHLMTFRTWKEQKQYIEEYGARKVIDVQFESGSTRQVLPRKYIEVIRKWCDPGEYVIFTRWRMDVIAHNAECFGKDVFALGEKHVAPAKVTVSMM